MIQHILFYLCTKCGAFNPKAAIPIIFYTNLLGYSVQYTFLDRWSQINSNSSSTQAFLQDDNVSKGMVFFNCKAVECNRIKYKNGF